jgi:ABC-type amino acid transport substrate-binding protein
MDGLADLGASQCRLPGARVHSAGLSTDTLRGVRFWRRDPQGVFAMTARRVCSRAASVAAVLLIAAVGLAAAACGSSGGGSASSSPAPSASASGASALTSAEQAYLAQKGTLQIGAFNDYPPFGFVDKSGKPVGIAVDYWKLVAQRLGVQVVFTPVLFADQLAGLRQGRFDSLQGIFPLAERKQWFAFSRPYFSIDTRIYTAAGAADLTTLKALKGAKGLKVAVVKGDSGQQIADAAGLGTLAVKGYPQAVKAVASGAAQAMILDQMVADWYIKEFKVGTKVKAVGKPVATGLMTMPVRKDDTVLLGILDKGLAMVGDSEFEGIYEDWMGK